LPDWQGRASLHVNEQKAEYQLVDDFAAGSGGLRLRLAEFLQLNKQVLG
jgi:hypothetical protein